MRGTIKTLTGVSALAVAVSCSEKRQAPNILFCIADDASFEHWGAMGCDWVNTPAFDRYPFDDPAKAKIYEDVVSGRIPEPWNHSKWVIRTDYPQFVQDVCEGLY